MAIIYVATNELEKHFFDEDSDISTLLEYAIVGYAFQIPDKEDRALWNTIIDEEWGGLDDTDFYRYDKPYVRDDKWHTEYEEHFISIEECITYLTKRIKQIEYIPEWAKMMKLKE